MDDDLLLGAAMAQRTIAPLVERLRQVALYVDYRRVTGKCTTPKEILPEYAD